MNWPTLEEYAAARPFPHAVIDGFIDPEWAAQVAAEFPPLIPEREGVWDALWHHFESPVEDKWQMSDPRAFGDATARLCSTLLSRRFTMRVEQMIGADRALSGSVFGGGYHLIRPGGFLGMHTDSLHDPDGEHWETEWYRCVNLLVFLTDNEDDPSAALKLRRRGEEAACWVAPKPGRATIFTTTGDTLHGHPAPLAVGDRRSFAVYYYAPVPPPWWTGDQPTTFVEAQE